MKSMKAETASWVNRSYRKLLSENLFLSKNTLFLVEKTTEIRRQCLLDSIEVLCSAKQSMIILDYDLQLATRSLPFLMKQGYICET